jgi:GT2 family glycosyltransferase
MDVTISVVTYNSQDLLRRCLKSIYRYTKNIAFEVVVVDNASQDHTVSMVKQEFPQVKLIANKTNNYYARANNQALSIAKGKYFLILNSDTYFIDNSVDKMIAYMEKNENIGALEGLEIFENGKLVQTSSLFSTPLIDFYELSLIGKRVKDKKLIQRYRLEGKNRKKTFPIDVGCDAFLLTITKLFKKINGYDEKFLLYYTENDICLRIKQLGYDIVHYGEAKVYHKVSAIVNTMGWKKTDIYYKDLLYYYKKHGYSVTGTMLFLLLKFEEVLLKTRESIKSL